VICRVFLGVLVATIISDVASAEPAVTFSKDIAPIVFAKCAMCHHAGGSAPFSLLTYATARSHATQIGEATRSGLMPPWKAEAGVGGDFIGQQHLTDQELAVIQQWVQAGAPEGEPRDLPSTPRFTDDWQLGRPDLVVTTPAYTLGAGGKDVFRIFVIPIPVSALKFVRGLEFRPGNPGVVHHANIRIDETGASRAFDAADPAPGYEGLIAHSATYPDGHFLGWTPGQVAPLLPKGLAWRLNPGADLVVELHMQPSGKPELVQPTLGFYFGADPPERTPAMLRLGRQTIDISPGVENYTISDSFVLPVDVEVEAVQPHAHNRAKEITGYATLPDGTNRPLIHIKDWDFRWQHVYRYVRPFMLPRGTRLSMRYVYDNSANNPRNPDHPPRRVYWGQRSSDEMGDLWIQVLTRTERDLQTLESLFGPKVMAEDVIGYERWIQAEPRSPALHDDVGVLYLRLNRADDAVRHFRISVELQPDLAAAHFNLGTALTVAERLDEATTEYQRALELKPDYARAHNNLGGILLHSGRLEDAIGHFEKAIRIDPENAEAHRNLGAARQLQGRMADAITQYKRAVLLSANNWLPALTDLAWLLACADDDALRDPSLALRLAERAVALSDRRDAAALDVLGAGYAASAEFGKALEAAEAALALAPANASAIRERRDLYTRSRPYRLPER
jgi:tetratricopeptide (TPR) repeat protein